MTKVSPTPVVSSTPSPFGITREGLREINIDQMTEGNLKKIMEIGGLDGLAKKLNVNPLVGLSEDTFEQRQRVFGANVFEEAPSKSFISLFLDTLKDTTIIVLILAAVASTVTGTIEDPSKGWTEGITILFAVFLVGLVSASSNYTKEKQFRALNAKNDEFTVKILRKGKYGQVPVTDINVGDIIVLENGDRIPGDAVFLRGQDVKCNESSLTGEPDDVKKTPTTDPFLLSGCLLSAGRCEAIVTAIGVESRWGRIKSKLVREERPTPLMEKLDEMVKFIGYGGMSFAVATCLATILLYVFSDNRTVGWMQLIIDTFIVGVTIIVVAIPEGLPLAVTISLSYSTKKMLRDNNLIRVLAACETMGNVTSICSDKTGTLTENRMTVVAIWACGKRYSATQVKEPMDKDLVQELSVSICVNSTAELVPDKQFSVPTVQGNKTEGALLLWLHAQGIDYAATRTTHFKVGDRMYSFSSERKTMSTIIKRTSGGFRVFSKGAAEIILQRCTQILSGHDVVEPLGSAMLANLNETIVSMAQEALRTVCVSYRDYNIGELPSDLSTLPEPPENEMIFCAIFGIMDPLRSDVIESISSCRKAGIMVRMVTGDNIHTARAIAKQCGILTSDGIALEGPTFRNMPLEELTPMLSRLQVLARSSPDDKYKFVNLLRDRKEVVGVTGDGTNDAPALRAADVGLAMGIAGTDLAKEASDIIIMDDRFSSIKKSVLWGRCVYDNIRKFIQFQLTVNIVALMLTLLSAIKGFEPPLNPVMMLWVNLIMDTMGALALGTETPKQDLLNRRPYKKEASIMSHIMIKNIAVQSTYQLLLLLYLLFFGAKSFNFNDNDYCLSSTIRLQSNLNVTLEVPCVTYTGQKCPSLNCSYYANMTTSDLKPNIPQPCLSIHCNEHDYSHFTFIFNVFVFCQLFNEINARNVSNDWNVYKNLASNAMFMNILIITGVVQALFVEFGGDFTRTTGLSLMNWIYSVLLGAVSLPLGILMRFIPIQEAPWSFANPNNIDIE
ncbi:calcium-transporting ATPase [Thraustotheca clavata]|uniref:Calcium-transporting ATPase n=1 Tax=Thraustotheca clavata TaxID=74557 RepID=A0A1V9Y863_9STRA|nr:calcium-transporting ATPase [Thraustotheca clavata]